ncbi:MAG TPA: FAD-dependent oxidoreductase, partial [Pirellulaceae bacterium]|nr:FAD-dependent oxidoreductase [Pirellulaceae bacterium]
MVANSRGRWDVIVIGGGAAGLFAATVASQRGRRVLLIEKNPQLGVKILMSGGTRCNITQDCTWRELAERFEPAAR